MDPVGAGLPHVVNFLSKKASEGRAYRSVNNFRSAISAGHSQLDGKPIGMHPVVCKLLKGIRVTIPPKPKYSSLWDVSKVLDLFNKWPHNDKLTRKQLSSKLAMLLCLSACRRSSDAKALDLAGRVFTPQGVSFNITSRTKTMSRCVDYHAFPNNPKLCVVQCLKAYEECTRSFRTADVAQLLIALQKPHKPVTAATIARWLKDVMREAGIDTQRFGAHSIRGSMASKTFMLGSTVQDIMHSADWSSESTFKQF